MKYEVNYPEHSDKWATIESYDAEGAAEKYGKNYNEGGDYGLMNESIIVRVREEGKEEITLVTVSAEPDIHYSAYELEEYKCKKCDKDLIADLKRGEVLDKEDFCSKECYREYYRIKL